MYKAVAKCNGSYAILNEDTNEVEALDYKDLSIVLYFGIGIDGLAVSSGGDIIETTPLEVLSEADIADEDEYLEDDFDFDYEDELEEFFEDEEDYEDFSEGDYEDYEEDFEEFTEEYEESYPGDELEVDWDEGDDDFYDVAPTYEETKVSKLHKMMNPAQVKLLKSYYLWFSRRLFTEAEKDPTFGMKDKTRIAIKTASLNALRNSGGMWKYAGFIDTGYDGGGYCTLGHKLRYMHVAWDVTQGDIEKVFFGDDYNHDIDELLESENCIIFGIKCVSDFFEVDSECMASLKKAQSDSIKDMELMYDIIEAGEFDKAVNSFEAMDEIVKVLIVKETKKKLAGKENECIVNPALLSYYRQFRDEGMLVPQSLIYAIRDGIVGHDGEKFIQKTWYRKLTVTGTRRSEFGSRLSYIVGKGASKVMDEFRWIAYPYNIDAIQIPSIWLMYWFCYKCCGYYEFDGSKYHKDGGKAESVVTEYKLYKKHIEAIEDSFSMETAKSMVTFYKELESLNTEVLDFYYHLHDSVLSKIIRDYTEDYPLLDNMRKTFDSVRRPHDVLKSSDTPCTVQNMLDLAKTTSEDAVAEIIKLIGTSAKTSLKVREMKNFQTDRWLEAKYDDWFEGIESIEMKFVLAVSNTLLVDFKCTPDSCEPLADEKGLVLHDYRGRYIDLPLDIELLKQRCIDERNKYINKLVKAHDVKVGKTVTEESSVGVSEEHSFEEKVSCDDALNYLLNNEITEETVKDKKYEWNLNVLNTIKESGKDPTKKQAYYLYKLYTHLTGKEVAYEADSDKQMLDDYPDYVKAIKYVLSIDDSSFVSTVCKSVNKYGTFTEKQKKYLEKALHMYEESKK